jgi:hypothetical protein
LKSLDRNSDLAARIKSTNPLPFKQDTSIQQQPPTNGNCQHSTDVDAWTADQQRQLEVALRSVPSGDPERWEKVAELVEGKSKKDCIKRYKHLADLVKASKGAKTS